MSKKHMITAQRQEARAGLLFASPFIIGVIVFAAFPFLMSLYYSFTNYNMKTAPKFLGLTNYQILFTSDSLFLPTLYNTLVHVVISVPLYLVFSMMLALLLNSRVWGINLFRTIYYLPNVVSMIAMSLLWLWMFQPSFGLINQLLSPLYHLLGAEPIGWLTDPAVSKISIALMGLWTCGGNMVIYLAALQDIPQDLHEAAEIDGAGPVKRFFSITLPLMTPSIFYNLIMAIISGFQVFMQAMIMTDGGPANSTYYYAYYLYEKAFKDSQMGMACAMAWVLLLITLAVTLVVFATSKKWVFYMSGDNT